MKNITIYLKKYIEIISLIFMINWLLMVLVMCYMGGLPSLGGEHSSGDYILRDHGRVAAVSENIYIYLLFYETISFVLFLLAAISFCFLPPQKRLSNSILEKPVSYFFKKRAQYKCNNGGVMKILLENYDDNKSSIDIIRKSGDEEAKKLLSEYEAKNKKVFVEENKTKE